MNKIKLKCKFCNKEFEKYKSSINNGEYKFCSNECRLKSIRVEREERICPQCNKIFYARIKENKKYCSAKCSYESKHKMVKCICGKEFIRRNPSSKFCSEKCMGESYKNRIKIICKECGEEFEAPASREKTKKFCSKNCHNKNMRTIFNEYFFEFETSDVAYWAGFLMADGSVAYKNNSCTLSLNLSIKDKEHLNKYIQMLNIICDLKQAENKFGKYYRTTISSPILKDSLKKWGIVPNKTYIGEVPSSIPNNLISHYIRGLIEGDGSIIKNNNIININITNNKNICEWIQKQILKIHNIKSYITLRYKNEKNGHETYRLNISRKKDVIKILYWLYEDSNEKIRMTRKYNNYIKIIENKEIILKNIKNRN